MTSPLTRNIGDTTEVVEKITDVVFLVSLECVVEIVTNSKLVDFSHGLCGARKRFSQLFGQYYAWPASTSVVCTPVLVLFAAVVHRVLVEEEELFGSASFAVNELQLIHIYARNYMQLTLAFIASFLSTEKGAVSIESHFEFFCVPFNSIFTRNYHYRSQHEIPGNCHRAFRKAGINFID